MAEIRDRVGRAGWGGYPHAAIIGSLLDTACGFAASIVKPGRLQIFAAAELAARSAPDKLLAVGDAILVPGG